MPSTSVAFPHSDPLATLHGEQEGVASLDQLRAAGITSAQLRHRVRIGRWQRVHPHVYALFSGPLSRLAEMWAAVLYAGPGALLSHDSAAEAWRLREMSDPIHVTVPYERTTRSRRGVRIHRSRRLDGAAHEGSRPPRTRVERTVADLLDEASDLTAALGVVADAVQRRKTSVGRLRAELAASPTIRWRRQMLGVLADIEAGAHSVLELSFRRAMRRHGLPEGHAQAGAGGQLVLDVLYDDYDLHVELDGQLGHDRATERWRDMTRDNAATLAGRRVLRFGWADLLGNPCGVAEQVAAMLRLGGWTGQLRHGARCRPR